MEHKNTAVESDLYILRFAGSSSFILLSVSIVRYMLMVYKT